MKFYVLVNPKKLSQFATCSVVGAWGKGTDCKVCTRRFEGQKVIVSPLIIEWEPGSDNIGDFTWELGSHKFLVRNRARLKFVENGFRCRFDPVIVKRPTTYLRSKWPRVAFPYKGPKLYWVRAKDRVHVDVKLSRIGLEEDCPCRACGVEVYEFRRERLVIRKSAWAGQKMFEIAEFAGRNVTFITEAGLNILERAGLSNWSVLMAGDIR